MLVKVKLGQHCKHYGDLKGSLVCIEVSFLVQLMLFQQFVQQTTSLILASSIEFNTQSISHGTRTMITPNFMKEQQSEMKALFKNS